MKTLVCIACLLICWPFYSQNIIYEYAVNWTEQNSGINTRLNCVTSNSFSEPNTAYACGVNGTVLKTTNSGANWISVGQNWIPGNVNLTSIAMFSSSVVITSGTASNETFVYRTFNGGENWSRVFAQENGDIKTIRVIDPLYAIMIGDPVEGRWSIWKTTNSGESWDSTGMYLPQQKDETTFQNAANVERDFGGTSRIWIGTDNYRIYYSSNTGSSWVTQQMPEQSIYSICSIGRYAMSGGQTFYSSNNYGITWEAESTPGSGNINAILYPGLIIITPHDNLMTGPKFFIRNSKNIYFNSGTSSEGWEADYSATSGNYTGLGYSYNRIWAIRDNGGITLGQIDIITSVPPNSYPYSFELKQNYPNPFNPKTTIPVVLHKQAQITLNIYNSTGEWLQTLYGPSYFLAYDEDYAGDVYLNFEWDGTNYSTGTYFYEVIAEDYRETRKMMLIK